MAKNETRPLSPAKLTEDREVYAALKDMADYAPVNPEFSHVALDTAHAEMIAAEQEDAQASARADAARDNKIAAQWKFHNKTLGGKAQVNAQYGPNSNEWQSLKLKKKTEYKTRSGGGKKGEGS